MTPAAWRRDEARRWLVLAGSDLNAARLLTAEEPAASLFHCQQAAEKTAKAFLAFHNVAFRKTHDLRELGYQCSEIDAALTELWIEVAGLTDYAVAFRYPDAPRDPDEAEACQALALARALYDRVWQSLKGNPV